MLFDKFNVEWSKTCKTKDYLFVGQISKYTKVSFLLFFQLRQQKNHIGVIKTHANPYFCESLSYDLSYESKFGSYIKKLRGTEFFHTHETQMPVVS